MTSPPLFRFNERARATSLGIALCTMFIVASFSVVGGLRTSMEKLSGNYSTELYLLTMPGDDGLRFFSVASLTEIYPNYAMGTFTTVRVLPQDIDVTLFSITNEFKVIPENFVVSGSDCLAGSALDLMGDVTLVGRSTVQATVEGRYSSTLFPDNWLLCSREVMARFAGEVTAQYNFAFAKRLNDTQIERLSSLGFVVQPTVGIMDFLETGVDEIENDATWVLVPSSFVIAVLAYSFTGSETADRRHEIGIIKTLGAGRKRVLGYLLLNALVISVSGGVFGVALGIVLSYAMSTAVSSIVSSVFVIETSELLLVSTFLVTLAAGVVGAIIPSVRMVLTSPVQDLREVSRSS